MAEIERPHLRFFDSTAEKLYKLLLRSELGRVKPYLHNIIKEVSSDCDKCQEFFSKRFRFRVSLPDEIII